MLVMFFSLTQVVPSHTHVSPNGNVSLIGLAMLSDNKHLQFCTTVPPLSASDHLGVSLALNGKHIHHVIFQNPDVYGCTTMQISLEHVT